MSAPDISPLLTELEAATVLQVSPEQVVRLIEQGHLRYVGATLSGTHLYRANIS
jgi:hypothetical protein